MHVIKKKKKKFVAMELAELIAGSTGFAVCMSRVYKSLPGL